jgi:glycosyltransferase involved in cell wall biosynthesis
MDREAEAKEPCRVTVVVLSCDRPGMLRETLRSVLGQASAGFRLIVSDNSSNDQVATMLTEEFPAVECRRRQPQLPALTHFRTVIEEAAGEYLVMFHDDDLMAPTFVAELSSVLDANPDAAAAACNAYFMQDGRKTDRKFFEGMHGPLVHRSAESLLVPYLRSGRVAPAPFPGYMYRLDAIRGLALDPREGGKYSDVSFLIKTVRRGAVIWIEKPLMWYRLHGGNDSGRDDIAQRLKLVRFIGRSTSLNRRDPLLTEFRFRIHLMSWRRVGAKVRAARPGRYGTIGRFLLRMAPVVVVRNPAIIYLACLRLAFRLRQWMGRSTASKVSA